LMDNITASVRKISATLPPSIQVSIEKIIKDIGNSVNELVGKVEPFTVSNAGIFAKSVAEGFLMVIVTIISAYFFTATRDELVIKIKHKLPESLMSYLHLIYDNFKAAFGGYFKAQFKIMIVLTVIMFIGFEILKINYSFVFAIGIAFLDLLPVFGTGAILWPWALINIISGNYVRAISLIAIYIICQVIKQVLQPKMVGDSIGLNPLTTLIFMYIGYQFAGVFGMIIGIPIGMVLVNMYKIGIFDRIIRGFKIIAKDINEFRKF
ncbi:MAG: AI-2E family transporter, partial [Mobilitalea sp.]